MSITGPPRREDRTHGNSATAVVVEPEADRPMESVVPSDPAEKNRGVGLADSAAGGVRWSFFSMLARQVGRLGFALVLARLLGPKDFGVAAEATIYLSFTAVLLEVGFGAILVHRQISGRDDVGAVYLLSLGTSTALVAVTMAGAPALSALFGTPALTPVLRVLAIGVLAKGFAVVPSSLLNSRMRFKALALCEISAVLLAGGVGIAAAALHAGYWALVIQQILTDLLYVLFLQATLRELPRLRSTWAAIVATSRLGFGVLGGQMVGYLARNLDSFVVATFLGAEPLAFYMVAYRIMLVPVALFGSVANRVGFPIFARLQDDHGRFSRYFLHSTEAIAVVVVPLMASLALLAPEITRVVFGNAWLGAVPTMRVLALNGIVQALVTACGAVFMAIGRGDLSFRWSLIPTIVSCASFFAGIHWGILGLSVAYTIATIAVAPYLVRAVARVVGFRLTQWLGASAPAIVAAVPATVLAGALRLVMLSQAFASWLIVLITGAVFFATYVGMVRWRSPMLFRRSLRLGRLIIVPRNANVGLADNV